MSTWVLLGRTWRVWVPVVVLNTAVQALLVVPFVTPAASVVFVLLALASLAGVVASVALVAAAFRSALGAGKRWPSWGEWLAVLLLTAGLLNAGLLALVDAEPLVANTRGLAMVFALLDLEPARVLRAITPFLVMTVFYFTLFWTITGRTPGARLLGVRVVGPGGDPPRAPWALTRAVAALAGLGAGALGWLWTALDAEKRGWHDYLGRTYVVRDA